MRLLDGLARRNGHGEHRAHEQHDDAQRDEEELLEELLLLVRLGGALDDAEELLDVDRAALVLVCRLDALEDVDFPLFDLAVTVRVGVERRDGDTALCCLLDLRLAPQPKTAREAMRANGPMRLHWSMAARPAPFASVRACIH